MQSICPDVRKRWIQENQMIWIKFTNVHALHTQRYNVRSLCAYTRYWLIYVFIYICTAGEYSKFTEMMQDNLIKRRRKIYAYEYQRIEVRWCAVIQRENSIIIWIKIIAHSSIKMQQFKINATKWMSSNIYFAHTRILTHMHTCSRQCLYYVLSKTVCSYVPWILRRRKIELTEIYLHRQMHIDSWIIINIQTYIYIYMHILV